MLIISIGDNPSVLEGSRTQYFIGEFDGNTFINDNPADHILWLDYGRDNYAGVTWSDMPEQDGRGVIIGWMSNWKYANETPTEDWRGAMTLPEALDWISWDVSEFIGKSATIQIIDYNSVTKFVETVQFITDLVQKHQVSPDPLGLDVISQFGSGKLAMVGAGRWPLNGWKESGFTEFDVVPWPQKTASGTVFGTAGWGIGSATKNQELAWELIKEFDSVATQQETIEIGQQIPVLESLAQQPSFLSTPPANIELLWTAAQTANPVAVPIFFRDMEQIVMRNIEKSLAGEASLQEAMIQGG